MSKYNKIRHLRGMKGKQQSKLSKNKISKALTGENHPEYRKIGSISINRLGEKIIKIKEHLWITYYRYKVEKYIGYKIKKGWLIHHIDGNRQNNKLSNLYIFKKRGIHTALELLIRDNIIDRFTLINNLKLFKKEK
jgi:hypothetical protein